MPPQEHGPGCPHSLQRAHWCHAAGYAAAVAPPQGTPTDRGSQMRRRQGERHRLHRERKGRRRQTKRPDGAGWRRQAAGRGGAPGGSQPPSGQWKRQARPPRRWNLPGAATQRQGGTVISGGGGGEPRIASSSVEKSPPRDPRLPSSTGAESPLWASSWATPGFSPGPFNGGSGLTQEESLKTATRVRHRPHTGTCPARPATRARMTRHVETRPTGCPGSRGSRLQHPPEPGLGPPAETHHECPRRHRGCQQ